jgi:hypothetical protein
VPRPGWFDDLVAGHHDVPAEWNFARMNMAAAMSIRVGRLIGVGAWPARAVARPAPPG